jgi:hypothetical protein
MQWTALALSGAYLSEKIVLLKAARTSEEKGSVFVKLEKMKVPNLKLSMKKMKQNNGLLHYIRGAYKIKLKKVIKKRRVIFKKISQGVHC